MNDLSKSPDRHKFQLEKYIERNAEEGRTVDNDEEVRAMVEYYQNIPIEKAKVESTDTFKKNNMEYDLRSTQWICEKVRNSDNYAQNLYAAMCNRDFMRNDVLPILKEETWSCSWRYAGGIVADMRLQGDYIDWYCSGIRGDSEDENLSSIKYVAEGVVTDEIREDLFKLGWIVIDDE
jgi:hypothetical protein